MRKFFPWPSNIDTFTLEVPPLYSPTPSDWKMTSPDWKSYDWEAADSLAPRPHLWPRPGSRLLEGCEPELPSCLKKTEKSSSSSSSFILSLPCCKFQTNFCCQFSWHNFTSQMLPRNFIMALNLLTLQADFLFTYLPIFVVITTPLKVLLLSGYWKQRNLCSKWDLNRKPLDNQQEVHNFTYLEFFYESILSDRYMSQVFLITR